MKEVKKKTTKKQTPKKKNATISNTKKKMPTTKKAQTKKPVKKIVKKTVVIEEAKKPEKWYVWLKNNIVENEKEFSKEEKNRRLITSLFAIFCFLVVLFSTTVIDYYSAIKTDSLPLFVLKVRDDYKQATIYYGTFYKAWKCDNGPRDVNYGRFSSELGYCKLEAKYDVNGVYTNPHGVKITMSQMNIIKNYYFDDFVNIKTNGELNNAYKISTALNEIWWAKTESDIVLNNDPNIEIAIFGKTQIKDGIETWGLQYEDPKYYKCIKNDNGTYVFSTYNANKKTCGNDWKALSLDSLTCELAKHNTKFVSELVVISGLCK